MAEFCGFFGRRVAYMLHDPEPLVMRVLWARERRTSRHKSPYHRRLGRKDVWCRAACTSQGESGFDPGLLRHEKTHIPFL